MIFAGYRNTIIVSLICVMCVAASAQQKTGAELSEVRTRYSGLHLAAEFNDVETGVPRPLR